MVENGQKVVRSDPEEMDHVPRRSTRNKQQSSRLTYRANSAIGFPIITGDHPTVSEPMNATNQEIDM